MKKILIITDCRIGERLVERAIETYSKENLYYVIQAKEREYENAGPDRFKFFTFDPTSHYKLANVLKMDFIQIMIVMRDRPDAVHTLENIRKEKPLVRIVMLDQWGLELDDPNVLRIDVADQLSARLIDYLPNVPVIAQNVGNGEGEIMEVLVPFGSAYVYRHVGAVEQKQWRIAGIYRDRRLVLPTEHTMIHPNDLLLLIGEPEVLISVYRSIKRELGHFPAPYGTSIYVYVDMDVDHGEAATHIVQEAALLGERLQRPMVVRVANPGAIETLEALKSFRNDDVTVEIDYDGIEEEALLSADKRRYHAGLVVVSRRVFHADAMRRMLYDLRLPVFKLSERSVDSVKRAVVLLSESEEIEKITTTVFDVASQLEWKVELLEFKQDANVYREQIEQYYRNLSTIFSQSVRIVELEENPLRQLKKGDRFVHCLPFTEATLRRPLFSVFSTDMQQLHFHLDAFHQLFIPV